MLNHLPGAFNIALDAESATAAEDPDVKTNEPTPLEVIKKLKNGKATGLNGIPLELPKCAIGAVSQALHTSFVRVWRTGHVPAEWRDIILVTLDNGKDKEWTVVTTDQ